MIGDTDDIGAGTLKAGLHCRVLVHCKNLECVMRFSNSVEQVDLKKSIFCPRCAGLLALSAEKAS